MAKLHMNGKDVKGVYFHLQSRASLCQGTYSHYVAFGTEGWLFAPFIILEAQLEAYLPDGTLLKCVAQRGGCTSDQRLTYPGFHQIIGIVWHMVHAAEMLKAHPSERFPCEARWNGVFELSPQDSWETILEKSSQFKFKPSGT